jgi:hypothetical protein
MSTTQWAILGTVVFGAACYGFGYYFVSRWLS